MMKKVKAQLKILFLNLYEPVTKGRTKNGTMNSKFQLRNLTIISEFNERTNNDFKQTKNTVRYSFLRVDLAYLLTLGTSVGWA